MVGKFGEILLVDWGLAKVVGRPEEARAIGGGRDSHPGVGGQRAGQDAHGLGSRHAGVHEPRTGGRAMGHRRPGVRRLRAGGGALHGPDRAAAARERQLAGDAAKDPAGGLPPAPAGQPRGPPGVGGGLFEGDGAEAEGSVCVRGGPGRGRGALAGRRAGDRVPRAPGRPGPAVGEAAPDPGQCGRRAARRGGGRALDRSGPAPAGPGRDGQSAEGRGDRAAEGGGDQPVPG